MKNHHSLSEKKVIVLGGTSGLGLATAKAAAAEGAFVSIVSSNPQRIEQALTELPPTSIGQAIDLSKEANIKAFFNTVGKFDHLVYTAGENISLNTLDEMVLEDARQFFILRYWSALAAVKYGAPNINAGGSICLTSGIASTRPGKGWALASSLCGAMEGLVRTLAIELAPIRVNSIVPGVVKTNLWNGMRADDRESFYKTVGDSLPVKRVGDAGDIAQAFLYLMNQPFCTGQNLIVDGGAVLV